MSMTLLNRYYSSTAEELLTYYPRFYADVREMRAILNANGYLLDELQDNIEQVFFNNFIDYMDEKNIALLEEFLKINLDKKRSLEERRRLIKSFFVGQGHVSATSIREIIQSYTDADVDVYFEPFDDERNNMLYIDIERGKEETIYMADIAELLERKIPAHIIYRTAICYKYPIVVEMHRHNYVINYDLTGTKPDISSFGDYFNFAAVTEPGRTNYGTTYPATDGDEVRDAGTYPDISHLGNYGNFASVTAPQRTNTSTDYIAAADTQQAGLVPDVSVLANIAGASTITAPTGENTVFGYDMAGTSPDVSSLGASSTHGTQAGFSASEYSADYSFCGQDYASDD